MTKYKRVGRKKAKRKKRKYNRGKGGRWEKQRK